MLHITSGDIAGGNLSRAGLPGEIFVWHDILYDGPRKPGVPDDAVLLERAKFIEHVTDGGLAHEHVLSVLQHQYDVLRSAQGRSIVLWFDACLFDQSMLAHILNCLYMFGIGAELICIDSFPGIAPYNGIGQLSPEQLASVFPRKTPVTDEQSRFARRADDAFAVQDGDQFRVLAAVEHAPLEHIPAAVRRWMLERPGSGLGRLEQLALEAVQRGCTAPKEIFRYAASHDMPPQFWGDTMLWAKINGLAARTPPLVRIEGPEGRLPQWDAAAVIDQYRITAMAY